MNIKDKFLELTKSTHPHGTEHEIFSMLSSDLQKDEFGNLFIRIGESDVMFTCHMDTVSIKTDINHVIDGNIIKTDGKSILGADDKAGVTILSYMIENKLPGLYYFFVGEECGCVGSRKVANLHRTNKLEGINKVVSFDRRGTTSVITHQAGQRCCSEKFGEALSKSLNEVESTFEYKNDPTGIYTDSHQFTGVYPECTNLSVGYSMEHSSSESIKIDHLEKLANAVLKIDWVKLPVERDPSKIEYKTYGSYYDDYDNDYYNRYNQRNYNNTTIVTTDKKYFYDRKYDNFLSHVELDKSKHVVSVNLHKDRIAEEKLLIEELLRSIDMEYKSCTWDGFKLKVIFHEKKVGVSSADYTSESDRNDIVEFLPELDYSKGEDLDGVESTNWTGLNNEY
jgi:hypothetical protein